MTKSRHIRPYQLHRPWLGYEDGLMRELYPHVETDVVAWFLDRTKMSVIGRASTLGLYKTREMVVETARERSQRPEHGGRATQFKKGAIPPNKGRFGYCAPGSEKGWFPKGHQRSDTATVGAERICKKDGYIFVKVADKGDYALPWRLKQRVVWESIHGPIPPGHTVVFKEATSGTASPATLSSSRANNSWRATPCRTCPSRSPRRSSYWANSGEKSMPEAESKNDITTLRGHLFETLAALRSKENPMDLDRAKAIAEVAQTIVNSAKVEVDHMKVTGQIDGSGFISPNKKLPPGVTQHRLK